MIKKLSRNTLKSILRSLAKIAIRKHKIRIIAVSGWFGTWIVKEAVYLALKEDYRIRRNEKDIVWDFAIPLTVLGYEDKRYSLSGWLKVIFSTIRVLIFEKSNPHIQVLELDADKKEIYEYWMGILDPEALVLVNSRPELAAIEKLLVRKIKDQGLLVCDVDSADQFKTELKNECVIMPFGSAENLTVDGNSLRYDSLEFNFNVIHLPVIKDLLILALPVADFMNIDIRRTVEKLKRFEIPQSKLAVIKEKLNECF